MQTLIIDCAQVVSWHPSRPVLFVATQTQVKVFDLINQQLIKTLRSGARWISSMAVHASGDHVIIGSYDRRLCWFDLGEHAAPAAYQLPRIVPIRH